MLDRLKHIWNEKRKLCYIGIAVVLAFGCWIVLGQDVDPLMLVNKACDTIGGC